MGAFVKYLIGTLVTLIYGGLAFYIGLNIRALLQSYNLFKWPVLYWILFFILSFAFIIARLHPVFGFLSIIGNYWMFVLQYGLFLCLIANLVIWLTPLSTKMVGTSVSAIFVLLFVVGTYFAYTPTVHKTSVMIDKVGEPMRIVLATDLHLGYLSNKAHLQKFVDLSNIQQPDVVLLAGDIVDDVPTQYIRKNMDKVMRELNATYGVYGILGNHEYYGNQIELFLETMKTSNVTMLLDESIELPNGAILTGREDRTNKLRKSIESLKPSNSGAPWIVMNHTPDDFSKSVEAGVDLQLSGHTHRGQLWPNHLLTKRIYELDYGYKLFNKMHAYVSSGYGFWGPPMRIGTQAEIWVIDLQFSQAK